MSSILDPEEREFQEAMNLHRRPISDEQIRKFEGYAAEIFTTFGLNLKTPATKDTPRRFIKALLDNSSTPTSARLLIRRAGLLGG